MCLLLSELYFAFPHSQVIVNHADSIAAACGNIVYRHVHTSIDTALDVTDDFLLLHSHKCKFLLQLVSMLAWILCATCCHADHVPGVLSFYLSLAIHANSKVLSVQAQLISLYLLHHKCVWWSCAWWSCARWSCARWSCLWWSCAGMSTWMASESKCSQHTPSFCASCLGRQGC